MARTSGHGTQLKHFIITDIIKSHQSLDFLDYLCIVVGKEKEEWRERGREREGEDEGEKGGGGRGNICTIVMQQRLLYTSASCSCIFLNSTRLSSMAERIRK